VTRLHPLHLEPGPCVLRPWREDDAASLVRHANSRAVWQNLRDEFPHPYTAVHAAQFLSRTARADPPAHFAMVVDGEAVGGIGYDVREDAQRNGAELGYWLHESHWGRGIATAAVRAVTELVFSVHANVHRIYALSFVWNAASARVLEKAGYTLERTIHQGAVKEGRASDQLLYAVVRQEWENRL
jgi:[ribosomal protein S5]-alanine N-acetyltransferase